MKITLLISIFSFLTSFSFSQIVLNEVMANPSGGNTNQGLINFNGNQGREYIELYNPSCSSIDVAGYFVACRQDVLGTATGGAFRIPTAGNTLIAPGGHLVLGTASSSTVASNIDIVIPDFASNYCQNDPTRNFVMANTDGWIALYDATGTPIDAIYWASNPANISNASDYGVRPCVPSNSPAGLVLLSAQEINAGFPGVLVHAGTNPSANQTFSRINDGQTWQAAVVPSIDNSSATGNCNNGVCNQISGFELNATVVNPTCGESNGSISFAPSPSDTYFYTWPFATTGQTSSANNLEAGTYQISITNLSGCTVDTTITLTEPSSLNPSINSINPTCAGNDGSITLENLTGGNLTFTWIPNVSSNSSATNLNSGTYQISILDGNGCTWQTDVVLSSPTDCGCAFNLSAISSNPSCTQSNGTITISTSVAANYTYVWSANTGINNDFTNNVANLSAGTYSVTVTSDTCVRDTTIILIAPNPINDVDLQVIGSSCGIANGSASVENIDGGTAPFTYNLNNQGATNSSDFNNLNAGEFSLQIIDSEGCELEYQFIVPELLQASSLILPNVFTPNKDEINDIWNLDLSCVKNVEFKIINRWGINVFESTSTSISWDGQSNGVDVTDGVYFYFLELTLLSDEVKQYHGHITLVR